MTNSGGSSRPGGMRTAILEIAQPAARASQWRRQDPPVVRPSAAVRSRSRRVHDRSDPARPDARRAMRRLRRRCRRRRAQNDKWRGPLPALRGGAETKRQENFRNGRPTRKNTPESAANRTNWTERGFLRDVAAASAIIARSAKAAGSPRIGVPETASREPLPQKMHRSGRVRLRETGNAGNCESGGIGRRTGLRSRRGSPWGFESPLSHQNDSIRQGSQHPCKQLSRRSASSSAGSI
jgi:hypothetical protein